MIPVPINKVNYNNTNNSSIVLDPGLRTFMTGISNTEYLSIGSDIHSKIKSKLNKLSNIKNNKNISDKINIQKINILHLNQLLTHKLKWFSKWLTHMYHFLNIN